MDSMFSILKDLSGRKTNIKQFPFFHFGLLKFLQFVNLEIGKSENLEIKKFGSWEMEKLEN